MKLGEIIERLIDSSSNEERITALRAYIQDFSLEEVDKFADSLKNLITTLILENTDRAVILANSILLLAEITGKDLHRALGLRMKGMALVQGKGDCQSALFMYREAVSIHEANDDLLGKALVYLNEIWALGILGRYEEAILKGEWAKKNLEDLDERFTTAKVCNNLSWVYQRVGRFHQSLTLLDEAVRLFHEWGSEGEKFLSSTENNRALSLGYIGRYREATAAGERAIQWGEKMNQPIAVARAKHNLGIILSAQGHYTRALTLYEEAIEVHEAFHQRHEAALCKLSMTGCLSVMRRFDDVIHLNQDIQPAFHQLKMHHEEGLTIFFGAGALIELGKNDEAFASFQQAYQIFKREGNTPFMGRCEMGRARLFLRMGKFPDAVKLARKCAQNFKSSEMSVFYAMALLIIAEATFKTGEYKKCTRIVNKVRKILDENRVDELLYPCFQILGNIAQRQNRFDEAFEYLDRAIQAIEQLRGNIMVEFRAGFIEDKQNVYEEMVDLCLSREMPDRGFQYAERAKSRALLELLSYRPDMSVQAHSTQDVALVEELRMLREQREAKLKFGESLLTINRQEAHQQILVLQEEVRSLENKISALWHRLLTQNADYARDASLWGVYKQEITELEPDSILLEYYSIGNEWVVFLVFPDAGQKNSIYAFRLSATVHQVEEMLQRFKVHLGFVPRSSLSQIENLIGNAQKVLRNLYEYLIAPIIHRLPENANLLIVPHGSLHYVPFHALFDGEQYLIEKFQISYLPNAGLLSKNQESPLLSNHSLIIGHSYAGRLPLAVEEARRVAQLWNVEAICEQKAISHLLSTYAKSARLIHLACHGEFRANNPLFSGLVLEDGWLTTLDVFNLRLNASLVTLSACLTGRSVIGAGDELFGLMRAFLSAGAASLLLTHWPVADEATAQFMENFYRTLKLGATKGAGLQTIQREFIMRADESKNDYRHPYYWAPFFLIGQNNSL